MTPLPQVSSGSEPNWNKADPQTVAKEVTISHTIYIKSPNQSKPNPFFFFFFFFFFF